jgi:adenylylsulfate kinase
MDQFQMENNTSRKQSKGYNPVVLWFTGLSGSGKTTLAKNIESYSINTFHAHTYRLDGDIIRNGLNSDLGFENKDRSENVRRIAEVSRLMADAGLVTLVSSISPFEIDRQNARKIVSPFPFVEIYVKCPLEICEKRDPKGLYQRARNGKISQFTGIQSPYEEPQNPEIILDTSIFSINDCVNQAIDYLVTIEILGNPK